MENYRNAASGRRAWIHSLARYALPDSVFLIPDRKFGILLWTRAFISEDDRSIVLWHLTSPSHASNGSAPAAKEVGAHNARSGRRDQIARQYAGGIEAKKPPFICGEKRSWSGSSSPNAKAPKSAAWTQTAKSKPNSSPRTAASPANPSCPALSWSSLGSSHSSETKRGANGTPRTFLRH